MRFGQPLIRLSRRRRSRDERGFTLIELLVVLVILGLLASITAPRILGQLSGAKTKAASVQIKNIKAALEIYLLDVGSYPTTSQGLDALITDPSGSTGWNGPYLNDQSLPLDPWDEAYRYRSPGEHGAYDLFSFGADKQQGGDGENEDVTSW